MVLLSVANKAPMGLGQLFQAIHLPKTITSITFPFLIAPFRSVPS
jgi:hypothetical protein